MSLRLVSASLIERVEPGVVMARNDDRPAGLASNAGDAPSRPRFIVPWRATQGVALGYRLTAPPGLSVLLVPRLCLGTQCRPGSAWPNARWWRRSRAGSAF